MRRKIGVSTWSLNYLKFTLGIGSLGTAAIASELAQNRVSVWVVLPIALLPLFPFLFADPEDIPLRIARFMQVIASFWYLGINSALVIMFLLERPPNTGWIIVFLFVAVGAIPCLIVLGRVFSIIPPDDFAMDLPATPQSGEQYDLSHEVVYRPKMGEQILLLSISLLFVFGGVAMIRSGKTVGWLVAGFFGLGVVVFALQLITGSSFLRLTPDGMVMRSLWRSYSYRWTDISAFHVSVVSGRAFVAITFAPTFEGQRFGRHVARTLSGIEGMLPSTYGFSAEELVMRLNLWKVRYGASIEHEDFSSVSD